ncbi:hypothetical protein J5N97_027503 [Dioscorea zingiberensis]|uniref:SHSP domain-containing protein n=1 Tax=Dioscorea zingiberensis TaxID=325984 RepID=A0A9D5C496_9LILI|nr:hypothetical protein J5N97_027503 [Dioscorea zingiberensis]
MYRDFEPVFELVQEENMETLIIYLPDFKIEDIRVQIDSRSNLLIGGVRRLGQNEWVRFTKNFKIPDDCNADEIKANFSDETLQIWMPKKLITKVAPEKQKPEIIQEPPAIPKTEEGESKQRKRVEEEVGRREPEMMKDEKDDAKKEEDKLFPDSKTEMKQKAKVGNGTTLGLGEDKPKELLVNVVVALIVLLGIGMYVTFKMRKS